MMMMMMMIDVMFEIIMTVGITSQKASKQKRKKCPTRNLVHGKRRRRKKK